MPILPFIPCFLICDDFLWCCISGAISERKEHRRRKRAEREFALGEPRPPPYRETAAQLRKIVILGIGTGLVFDITFVLNAGGVVRRNTQTTLCSIGVRAPLLPLQAVKWQESWATPRSNANPTSSYHSSTPSTTPESTRGSLAHHLNLHVSMLPVLLAPVAAIAVPLAVTVLLSYGTWRGAECLKRKLATGHWRHRALPSPDLPAQEPPLETDGNAEPPTLRLPPAKDSAWGHQASGGTERAPSRRQSRDGFPTARTKPTGPRRSPSTTAIYHGQAGHMAAKSFGLETAGLRLAVDHSELTPALLGAVDEHLKHFEDSLSTISESEPGEQAVLDLEDPSARLPQIDNTDQQDFRRRHTRASSMPAPKPLKSALATSPPHSPPAGNSGSGGREKKKARFRDDSPGVDLSLRRTSTAPAEYGASSTSDFPWSGDEMAEAGGREERAGSEAEGSERGFEREDECPSSWVVQVQVEISIDEEEDVDEEAVLAGAGDAQVRTRVYSSGGGYGEVGESSAGECDRDVEDFEARASAAGAENRNDSDDNDLGDAEFGTQSAIVNDDRSLVGGEPCVCEPDVEAVTPAVDDDKAGQCTVDDEGEQTAGDDEDTEIERDTAEAEEADATSDRSHASCADSTECSSEDADPEIGQEARQTAQDLDIEQTAGGGENARNDSGTTEEEEADPTLDRAHDNYTDPSESLSKDDGQDNEQDAGQNDEEEAGAVCDAEDVDEANSAHLSTASSGLSSKDDGHEQGPYLTPEENSVDQIDRVVMTSSNVSDDGPIAMPADEQSLAEGTELGLIMPEINSSPTASPAQQQVPHRQKAPPTIRRLSDPDARRPQDPAPDPERRRASSMSDFQHLKTRLKILPFAAKAAPADPAITACSVRIAESPRLNTVYEHPGPQYGSRPAIGKGATETAQTVSSGMSTYQVVWEEPAPSEGSESDTTLIEPSEALEDADRESGGRSPSPMGKVKTKLAAWSWAREQQAEGEDSESGGSRPMLSLMRIDTDRRRERSEDHPYAPPNTEKHSASSSARHSGPQTPHEQPEVIAEEDEDVQQADDEAEVDEEEDQPMELRFKSAFHRIRSLSMPASTDYLTVPGRMLHSSNSPSSPPAPPGGLPRAMSNLAAEEARFMSHRDSLDLNHHRIEREARMNQLLMTTRDSFVMAKTKYEAKYPKIAGGIQYNRFGGLSTIPDASPPEDARKGFAALARKVEGAKGAVSEVAVKSDGHIKWAGEKKVEKPQWYKAKYMKGEGGVLNLVLLDEDFAE